MSEARFDPSHAIAFDLAEGLIHVEGAPGHAVVPGAALGALAAAAPDAAREAFGRALGGAIGHRVATRLGGEAGLRGASLEAALDHLGGEIALAGLGALTFEQWGEALLLVIDGCPLGSAGDGLLEAVLGAAVSAAAAAAHLPSEDTPRAEGASADAAFLGREGQRARFLITSSLGAGRVRQLLVAGSSWRQIVVRLHEERGGAA